MTIPHTNQGRKAFLAKLNEKRFRKKTKDGKTGPWMERKLENRKLDEYPMHRTLLIFAFFVAIFAVASGAQGFFRFVIQSPDAPWRPQHARAVSCVGTKVGWLAEQRPTPSSRDR